MEKHLTEILTPGLYHFLYTRGLRERVEQRLRDYRGGREITRTVIFSDISGLFIWEDTEEGHDYWEYVNGQYRRFRSDYVPAHQVLLPEVFEYLKLKGLVDRVEEIRFEQGTYRNTGNKDKYLSDSILFDSRKTTEGEIWWNYIDSICRIYYTYPRVPQQPVPTLESRLEALEKTIEKVSKDLAEKLKEPEKDLVEPFLKVGDYISKPILGKIIRFDPDSRSMIVQSDVDQITVFFIDTTLIKKWEPTPETELCIFYDEDLDEDGEDGMVVVDYFHHCRAGDKYACASVRDICWDRCIPFISKGMYEEFLKEHYKG